MSTLHKLFPVLVYEAQYDDTQSIKDILLEEGHKYFINGDTGEFTGMVTVHHDPKYYDLFKFISLHVLEYLKAIGVDSDLFEINIVKSWLNNILVANLPNHAHGDAHLSACFYLNIPENLQYPIRFFNYGERMEPFSGCIRWNNTSDNWDDLSSYSWAFNPKEGDLLIFPAKMYHETNGAPSPTDERLINMNNFREEIQNYRVSIALDIVLTYKEKAAKPLGIQPVKNWRTFI